MRRFEHCYILIIESKILNIFIENIIGLQRNTKTILEKCLVETG